MTAITDQVRWRRVLNHVAADLKILASIAADEKITVEQAVAASLKATVTPANLRGIIPVPHNATRIYKSAAVAAVDTITMYTVTGAYVLFIAGTWLNSDLSTDAGCYTRLYVGDDDQIAQYIITTQPFRKAGQVTWSCQHYPALEVPTTWTVNVLANNAGLRGYAGFWGWLEAV